MGLASKLAAAQGAAPPGGSYGAPPPPQQQQQQQPPGSAGQKIAGGYPGQQTYQAYPSQPPAQQTGYQSPAPYGQSQQYQPYPQQSYNQPTYGQPAYGQQQPQSPAFNGQSAYGQQPPQSPAYNRPPPPPPSQLTPGGYSSPAPQYGQSRPYGNAPPYSQTPAYGGQQPQGQQAPPQGGAPGGYPPQQQQQQYGQPPQQQQQYGRPQGGPAGYGGPGGAPQQFQASSPAEVAAYKQSLQQTIQEKRLSAFYPPNSPVLDQIAQRAAAQVDRLCQTWRIQKEIGNDIVKLALYDIVIYVDDSGSMQFEEKGERIKDLQLILERVAFAATLFDEDGVDVRFMNQSPPENMISGIRNEQQIQQLITNHKFSGLTPMGTELRKKVIDGIVLNKLRSGQMRKPVLVISITDGQPAGEPTDAVFDAVRYANNEVSRSQFGQGAIAFQFAQVGNDEKAREFLSKLDEDPVVGRMVDCTSNYENESAEMARANPPVDLTPDLWIVKLLLGAIDSSYDTQDEKTSAPQGYGGAPGGGYGGPPPPGGQYGGPPPQGGQYGGPPPQGGQYGGPPPGQYGQGQGQGQGQYGRPPPGPPGYGQQQQGGYGAPPPPPRY